MYRNTPSNLLLEDLDLQRYEYYEQLEQERYYFEVILNKKSNPPVDLYGQPIEPNPNLEDKINDTTR